ncbi:MULTISPECIES: hypothetical protein [Micromonospora]|uniref:tyrosine-type recombinase/integrase n=1 Tax=Micromonospora TaxID=1873 RepID=UPI001EEFDDCC|nr:MULTISPECIES: hypothetical protein [unclassified Micromonospora]
MDIERYVRWLQDVRRFQPSTVSRRLSVVVGFYRVCVIDDILPHSPADYVRRPTVPPESPTLGLGHLQFEALITTARLSANSNDFALIAMLGLLGLRILEGCGANIGDLGEEHGHRVLRVRGKGGKVVLVPLPLALARAVDRAVDGRLDGPILRNTLGTRMDRAWLSLHWVIIGFWDRPGPGTGLRPTPDPRVVGMSPSPVSLAEHRVLFGVGHELPDLLRTAATNGDLGSPRQRLLA